MRKIKQILVVVVYLFFAALNTSAELAYFQCSYKSMAKKYYRSDLGVSLVNLIPIIPWISTLAVTGFYEHGFCLTRGQCEKLIQDEQAVENGRR